MLRHRNWIGGVASLAAAAALVTFCAPAASAAPLTKCPSGGTPPPGSTITGGLEVDGFCALTDVTVNGGVVVDPLPVGADPFVVLELRSGQVRGGIVVDRGLLSLGLTSESGGVTPTHLPVTVEGGITMNRPVSFGAAGATIRGGVRINGDTSLDAIFGCGGDPFCFASGALCSDDISGNVRVTDVHFNQIFVGDGSGEPFFSNGESCGGNTIDGSVLMRDTDFVRFDGETSEIEANTLTGSVQIGHSIAEVNENTVGGSLLCTNDAVIHPPAPYDVPGNTVRGRDTCD
jgi:hypothetical protein